MSFRSKESFLKLHRSVQETNKQVKQLELASAVVQTTAELLREVTTVEIAPGDSAVLLWANVNKKWKRTSFKSWFSLL